MDVRPFHLLEPEENGGMWLLLLTSTSATASRRVFETANRHAGGYGWEGVALYFLEEVIDDTMADEIELNCENDSFVACSRNPIPLYRLAELMTPLVHDNNALREVLGRAPIDGWTQQFLR